MRPKLLDLFCGAGGCSRGYEIAGFDVVGVDILPQPHYPGAFIQADWHEYFADYWREYQAVHASPPCQGYSRTRHLPWLSGRQYPMLIDAVRQAFAATDLLWVIENVADAPLDGPELCGAALGLPIRRHRRFESNILLMFPPCPGHPVALPGRDNMSKREHFGVLPGHDPRIAMGIDWMTRKELRQAIPPAYTTLIGSQLLMVR